MKERAGGRNIRISFYATTETLTLSTLSSHPPQFCLTRVTATRPAHLRTPDHNPQEPGQVGQRLRTVTRSSYWSKEQSSNDQYGFVCFCFCFFFLHLKIFPGGQWLRIHASITGSQVCSLVKELKWFPMPQSMAKKPNE